MATRNRSRSLSTNLPITVDLLNADGSTYGNYVGTQAVSLPETISDEVSPGYFGKSRRGQFLPVNPMTQTKTEIETSGVSSAAWEIRYNGNHLYDSEWTGVLAASTYWWYHGGTYSPTYPYGSPAWPSESVALTEALANARSRGFDILTFMAEWHKVVDMILRFRTRTLRRAERVADSIGSVQDPATAFAETWLEGRYGWRLLAYDIEGINEAIGKLGEHHFPLIRGYSTNSSDASYVTNLGGPANHYKRYNHSSQVPFPGYGSGVRTESMVREVRAGVILEAVIQDILEIDPLVTAWEVIPFSFILDWFINIGDVITAYSPFAQENLLGSWVKTTETVDRTYVMTPSTYGVSYSGWYYGLQGSPATSSISVKKKTVERKIGSPSASLQFRLNLDSLKLADLASVIVARYGKILTGLLKSTRI